MDKAYTTAGQANINQPSPIARDTVLTRLEQRVSWLSELVNRLETKMDFIDGPHGQASGADAKVPSGFLETHDTALGHFLERLSAQVNRLERIVG